VADVTCGDGTVLTVLPVPALDRDAVPYEVTLRLLRDGEPFGEVGERCGYFLASTAARLRAARAAGQEYPASSLEAGIRAWAADGGVDGERTWEELQRYLPRDRELFCFRARDPDDPSTVGELRATLEERRTWTETGWQLQRLTSLRASGDRGLGVRALLDSDQLVTFLECLVQEFAQVGAAYEAGEDASGMRRPVG
jgi:CubicO group peptidase (beta-lactamase class C family)